MTERLHGFFMDKLFGSTPKDKSQMAATPSTSFLAVNQPSAGVSKPSRASNGSQNMPFIEDSSDDQSTTNLKVALNTSTAPVSNTGFGGNFVRMIRKSLSPAAPIAPTGSKSVGRSSKKPAASESGLSASQPLPQMSSTSASTLGNKHEGKHVYKSSSNQHTRNANSPGIDMNLDSDNDTEDEIDLPPRAVDHEPRIPLLIFEDKIDDEPVRNGTRNAVDEGETPTPEEAVDDLEEDSETPEDEFEVEAIRKHKFQQRVLMLYVKWKNYPEKDNTWEPEKNLAETADEILQAYYASIGGRPVSNANVSRPRKSGTPTQVSKPRRSANTKKTTTPKEDIYRFPTPPQVESEPWQPLSPKSGNWEHLVAEIVGLQRNEDDVKVFVTWIAQDNYGNRYSTAHDYWAIRLAAPDSLLRYYESHVDFGDLGQGVPASAIHCRPVSNAQQSPNTETSQLARKRAANAPLTAPISGAKKQRR